MFSLFVFYVESHVHQAIGGGGSGFCWLVVQNHGAQPTQHPHPQHWVNRPTLPWCTPGSCLHTNTYTVHTRTQAITHIGTFFFILVLASPLLLFPHQQQGPSSHCTVRPQLHRAGVKSSHSSLKGCQCVSWIFIDWQTSFCIVEYSVLISFSMATVDGLWDCILINYLLWRFVGLKMIREKSKQMIYLQILN